MRRLFICGTFLLFIAFGQQAIAQLSQQHSTQSVRSFDVYAPAPPVTPPVIGRLHIASKTMPPASQSPPPADPPQQPDGGPKPDRNHGHGDYGHQGHHGHWHGGGLPWIWPIPVAPVVYPYFSTPAFFGYNPAFGYLTSPYNTAAYSSTPYNSAVINTAPIVPPGPTAVPGDAIKNTNAEQKARAGRFIGFGDSSYAKQKYLAALGRYKTAIETAPDMAEGYFRQGFAHVALGQYENAAKAFRRGLLVRSGWRGSPFRLDTLYGAGGNAIKVQHLESLAEAVETNPFDADLLLVLGVALLFDGQVDRAELCFSRVTQLGGDSQRLLGDLLPQPKPAGALDPPAKATGKISF